MPVSLNKLKSDLTIVVAEFEKNQTELKKQISDLDILENKLGVLEKAIQDFKKDEKFLKVDNYFKLTFPNQNVELEVITQRVEKINKVISENIKRNEDIKKDINELDEFLKGFTQELTEKQLELTTNAKELLQQTMISFEQEVNSKLKLNIQDFDKESLATQLNQIRDFARLAIETQDQKIKDYNLLAELKKNVEPYLKYEQAKKTEVEIKDQKNFFEKNIRKVLDEEKGKVTKYLDEQVNTFFYEDLINDLYRRIDPHPDYKKIKFICDFKDDKPKLNVCLFRDEKTDDPIIPNLYFSTAQVNILSLSIFLAKALNAKDDDGNPIDCIFIDDPIQSLDSINILSTIDLFRSLVKNKGKQIILSTHDENFHNLLKKKMPTNLFKSKFMELETFGKVKKEQ
jgi:exonuclease SbcC